MCEDGSHKPDAGVVYLFGHYYVELGNGNRVDVQLDRMCSVKRDTHIQNQQSHQRPHTMPYLYTSIKLGTKAIQSPDYQRREIAGLSVARLEDVGMLGVPSAKQLAYDGYLTNLPAFLKATASQKRQPCHKIWFTATLPSVNFIPLQLPPLMVNPVRPIRTEDERNAFKESLNHPSETIKGPQGEAYLLRNITPSIIANLPRACNPNTPSTPDATSLAGMQSYFMALRILSLFLSTHTYPAYPTDEEDSEPIFELDSDIFQKGSKGFKPTPKLRGYEETYTARNLAMEGMSKDAALSGELPAWMTQKYTIHGAADAVLVAKPAPLRVDVNYGSPTSVPNFPGYVLPYFRGLIDPSKHTMVSIMKRFFLGCFGDTQDAAMSAWGSWVRGLDKWYKTEAGREISHIFFCVQLALESQSRLYVLMSGSKYLGSCLLAIGSQFGMGELCLRNHP